MGCLGANTAVAFLEGELRGADATAAEAHVAGCHECRRLIAELVSRLDRRMAFGASINERELYISIGDVNLHGAVQRLNL